MPGFEKDLGRVEEMYRLHRVAGPDTTLWDPWLPMSVLWFETTNQPSTDYLRRIYRDRLLNRRMDAEGYVSTQQHEGLAHSMGWPFPLWTQAGGIGWMFTTRGVPYGPELGVHPTTTVTNWIVEGATTARLGEDSGWQLALTASRMVLTSPPFRIEAAAAPFLRLKWSGRGLGVGSVASVEWQAEGDDGFKAGRRVEIPAPERDDVVTDVDVPLYRQPQWGLPIVRFRITIDHAEGGGGVTLLRAFTAIDSRHNINNAAYLQACDDYVRWTGDLDFLRANLQRMRLALAWAIHEFEMADRNMVRTSWPGHEGRSGHRLESSGKRRLLPGVGVGNNYWDLLPFGGEDALATVYYFDAIRRMAAIERQADRHPGWNLPAGPLAFEPGELLELAQGLQQTGNERFWNQATGRFVGWRDLDGRAYDYGFTFLNNEAIYCGFASEEHARSIREWMDGRRVVGGDTSTGSDIYHWRFGPRTTTRRNLETYFWGWSDPAAIPWGGQVQDGGGVLGFSFHDLMARLRVNGPNDAWARLREIIAWFSEVQESGGYRKYYGDGSRGTLQGGGTAGGLGMDHEFFESVLVPQVMIYGFLGFRPRLDGCLIAPSLPSGWPSLTVHGIRLHDAVLDVTATPTRVRVAVRGQPSRPMHLYTPGTEDSKVQIQDGVIEVSLKSTTNDTKGAKNE